MMDKIVGSGAARSPGFEPLFHFLKGTKEAAGKSWKKRCDMAVSQAEEWFAQSRSLGEETLFGFKMRTRLLYDCPPNVQRRWRALTREYSTCLIANFRLNVIESALTRHREHKLHETQFNIMDQGGTPAADKPEAAGADTGAGRVHAPDSVLKKAIKMQVSTQIVHRQSWALSRDGIDCRGSLTTRERNVCCAAHLADSFDAVLQVAYEDFLYSPEITMRRIGAFLGIDAGLLLDSTSKFHKASEAGACHVISNFGRLCGLMLAEAARGTQAPWGGGALEASRAAHRIDWMLSDPVNNCTCWHP